MRHRCFLDGTIFTEGNHLVMRPGQSFCKDWNIVWNKAYIRLGYLRLHILNCWFPSSFSISYALHLSEELSQNFLGIEVAKIQNSSMYVNGAVIRTKISVLLGQAWNGVFDYRRTYFPVILIEVTPALTPSLWCNGSNAEIKRSLAPSAGY